MAAIRTFGGVVLIASPRRPSRKRPIPENSITRSQTQRQRKRPEEGRHVMTKIDYLTYTVNATSTNVIEQLRESLLGGWSGKDYAQGRYTRTSPRRRLHPHRRPQRRPRPRHSRGAGCRELEHARAVTDWPEYLTWLLRAGRSSTGSTWPWTTATAHWTWTPSSGAVRAGWSCPATAE